MNILSADIRDYTSMYESALANDREKEYLDQVGELLSRVKDAARNYVDDDKMINFTGDGFTVVLDRKSDPIEASCKLQEISDNMVNDNLSMLKDSYVGIGVANGGIHEINISEYGKVLTGYAYAEAARVENWTKKDRLGITPVITESVAFGEQKQEKPTEIQKVVRKGEYECYYAGTVPIDSKEKMEGKGDQPLQSRTVRLYWPCELTDGVGRSVGAALAELAWMLGSNRFRGLAQAYKGMIAQVQALELGGQSAAASRWRHLVYNMRLTPLLDKASRR